MSDHASPVPCHASQDDARTYETKRAKIDALMAARTREDPCAMLRWRGVEGTTLVGHQRSELLEALHAHVDWEPPARWYSDAFGRNYGLPVD